MSLGTQYSCRVLLQDLVLSVWWLSSYLMHEAGQNAKHRCSWEQISTNDRWKLVGTYTSFLSLGREPNIAFNKLLLQKFRERITTVVWVEKASWKMFSHSDWPRLRLSAFIGHESPEISCDWKRKWSPIQKQHVLAWPFLTSFLLEWYLHTVFSCRSFEEDPSCGPRVWHSFTFVGRRNGLCSCPSILGVISLWAVCLIC